MDHFANPASLGGLIMCVAIAAWSIGRWQALVEVREADPPQTEPAPALQCDEAGNSPSGQQARPDARPHALEGALSLGELH